MTRSSCVPQISRDEASQAASDACAGTPVNEAKLLTSSLTSIQTD